MTAHYGTNGNDVIDGGNGADDIYGLGGDDIIYGGNGADGRLDGGDGNDQLFGENGADHLIGGAGDDLIDGNNGFDIAYYSGLIQEYTFLASAGYLHIRHLGGAGPDGHDQVIRVERLVFADRVINLGSGNNKPVAVDDHVVLNEDSGAYNSGASGVLANDFDFDGDAMSVTGGVFVGAYGTLTLNSDGTYSYVLSAAAQALDLGDTVQDSFNYTVTDNDGSDTGALVFNIAGRNDAPAANPDSISVVENNVAVLIDVLANDEDVDNEAVLTVTAASAPVGQGAASVVNNMVQYDPGSDLDSLAVGESAVVTVSYSISDEHGATSSSTVTVTVTGENDGPVANPDTAAGGENETLLIDAAANDTDVDNGAVLAISAASVPAGQGSASVAGGQIEFDPGTDFDDLALGETEEVIVDYTIEDEHGASSSSTVTITVAGANDAPVANPDSMTTGEASAVVIDVLANDVDVDNGAVLTVTAASAPAGPGSVSTDGTQVQFDPGSDFDSLAVGDSVDILVSYDISDEHGATSSSTVTVTVTGENDGPVANPDTAAGGENETLLIDAAANDTDVDNGAVLAISAASVPAGKGSVSAAGGQIEFDPGTDFDDLALGETEEVVVAYTIEDEHGASSSSTVTITVTGSNDAPVTNPDTKSTSENSAVVIDVLANDDDVDNNAVLTVTASGPPGKGTVTIVENDVRFDPGDDFDHLASGQTEVVVLDYTITDEHGASASSTITVTVQGRDEGVSNTGTEDGETLIGTPGDDEIDALGGDDNVFGLAGDDLLIGGNGSDFLSGDEDSDTLEGGNDDDFLSGGDGNDLLSGEGGNDTAAGDNGDDQLSGGDGLDSLSGGAGDDVIEGGADDDFMYGEEDDDQLSGQAGADILSGDSGDDLLTGGSGNDSLDGGDGEDSLDGGDGDDYLSGGLGANSMNGGLGNDLIVANSSDGAQTIDGGAGNDAIRHYYRSFASTITTGSGSDSIEIAHANVGTAAIVVTDFTAGAGGDVFRLSGDDGSLLSLLSGWDGGSNPFGAFLRLEQDGGDTLLQWDQDGSGADSGWQTLVVFQNSLVGNFTDANFSPAYHPDGSAPEGQTITGTNGSDSLTGTFGDDTIDGLGGDDSVSGLAGADTIDGGDGFDSLSGGAGDDIVEGGNDDDFIFGNEGNDQLSGDAGNDLLFGELGDDQLLGGNGDDSLDGSDGDDSLTGGDGQDVLSGGLGTNSLNGGLGDDLILADSTDGAQTIAGGDGNDTIRHSYRSSASTIATGSGVDTIELLHANVGGAAILVSDFTPGAGGDRFQLSGGDGALLSLLSGWDGSSNPFGSGFLRLQQNGADTLFQWDQDGSGVDSGWETLVLFQNTDVDDFTDANFLPAYHPGGGAPAGETITGTNDGDSLTGTIGDDTINALGGDDFVFGQAGADTILGGDGSDQLNGNGGNDAVEGGNGDDFLWGGEGNDQQSGQVGNDILFGENGDDDLTGGDGDDSLDGADGDDTLAGGDGQDYLSGGAGSDVMTGGANSDLFDLKSASHGPDEITDFAGGIDKIRIWSSGFEGGLAAGGPVSLVSGANPTATEAFGQFLYDTDDGSLFWDADGSGSGEAVLLATFTNVPSLQASDFFVI